MNRSTLKLLAIIIWLPALALALMPMLVAHTAMLDGLNDFRWAINGKVIAQMHHDVSGEPNAYVWNGVWIIAIAAEALMLGVIFFKPIRRSRHVITWRN